MSILKFPRLALLAFLFSSLISFHTKANEVDRNLFGIHKSISNGTYSFVKYHIGGSNFDVILDFDNDLGDIWELAYNPSTKLFYTYGKANYNTPSVLLEINAQSATVTNLGEITVNIGSNSHPSICTADGLTFNQTTNELIGTVDIVCGSWRSFRVVKFDLNTFGGATSVSCTQIGTLTTSNNLEFDAMAMADNNTLQGMDPDIPSNSIKFYGVNNVSTTMGSSNLQQTFSNWSMYRGIAFNKSENKMYTFEGQNGLRWLVMCNPSYGANAYNFSNATQYDLTGFEIRGIVFGSIPSGQVSLEENDLTQVDLELLDELELLIFPNPTTGNVEFAFDSDLEFVQILIIDSSGKLSYTANDQELIARKLDLTFLSEGVYMIHVVFEKGQSKLIRLVKQ